MPETTVTALAPEAIEVEAIEAIEAIEVEAIEDETPEEPPKKPPHPFSLLFREFDFDPETKALEMPWFTKIVEVEPGEPLDIPQPVLSGYVAIAMHKPHKMPQGMAEKRPAGYLFDYDNCASQVYLFDGETIAGFKPGPKHLGYTAYFLELHTYDPDSISGSGQRKLDNLQIKQAGLIPPTLTEDEEDALAQGKKARQGTYQRAARSVVTYRPEDRDELRHQVISLKLNMLAGLPIDAIDRIEGLARSGKYIAILNEQIAKFEEVPEDPKAKDSSDAANE